MIPNLIDSKLSRWIHSPMLPIHGLHVIVNLPVNKKILRIAADAIEHVSYDKNTNNEVQISARTRIKVGNKGKNANIFSAVYLSRHNVLVNVFAIDNDFSYRTHFL